MKECQIISFLSVPWHEIIFLLQGLHPRLITEGFELARNKSLEVRYDYSSEAFIVGLAS